MIIKKFKNGKIKLQLEKNYDYTDNKEINNEIDIDNVYYRDMTMSDLSINQINGYEYVVDYNTQLVYPLWGDGYQLSCYNPLVFLKDELTKNPIFYLYPETKKDSLSLLQDLDNGY